MVMSRYWYCVIYSEQLLDNQRKFQEVTGVSVRLFIQWENFLAQKVSSLKVV